MYRRKLLTTIAVGGSATTGCLGLGSESGEPGPGQPETPLETVDYTSGDGWPMAGRDPANSARTEVSGPAESVGAATVYRASNGSGAPVTRTDVLVDDAPAVIDGTVYLGGGAIDSSDGSVRWRADAERVGPTPALAHGHAFLTGEHGTMAVERESDDVRWTYPSGSPDASPVVDDQLVFVPTPPYEKGVVALDVDTGAEQWTYPLELVDAAGIALDDGILYVAEGGDSESQRGRVVALDAQTGTERWTRTVGRMITGPVAGEDLVYVGTVRGTLHAFGPGGDTKWKRSGLTAHHGFVSGKPALGDDLVFVPGNNGSSTMALDRTSGDTVWTTETSQTFGTPAVGNERVYVPAGTNGVLALERDGGAIEGRFTSVSAHSGLALTDTGLFWTDRGALVSAATEP